MLKKVFIIVVLFCSLQLQAQTPSIEEELSQTCLVRRMQPEWHSLEAFLASAGKESRSDLFLDLTGVFAPFDPKAYRYRENLDPAEVSTAPVMLTQGMGKDVCALLDDSEDDRLTEEEKRVNNTLRHVANFLYRNENIRFLKLKSCHLNHKAFRFFCLVLDPINGLAPRLKGLDLSHQHPEKALFQGDPSAKALARFEYQETLNSFLLECLGQALAKNTTLCHLDISGNPGLANDRRATRIRYSKPVPGTFTPMRIFMSAVVGHPRLGSLIMADVGFSEQALDEFGAPLYRKQTQLRVLDLSRHPKTAQSIETTVMSVLMDNPQVKELHLQQCGMKADKEGFGPLNHLCRSISQFGLSLEKLDLQGNPIRAMGVPFIAEMVANSGLRELNLVDCGLSEADIQTLIASIQQKKEGLLRPLYEGDPAEKNISDETLYKEITEYLDKKIWLKFKLVYGEAANPREKEIDVSNFVINSMQNEKCFKSSVVRDQLIKYYGNKRFSKIKELSKVYEEAREKQRTTSIFSIELAIFSRDKKYLEHQPSQNA